MVLALWESTLDNQMLILPGKQTVPFSLSSHLAILCNYTFTI